MFDFLYPKTTRAVLAALAALDFGKHNYVASDYRAQAAQTIRRSPQRTAQTLEHRRNPSAVALLAMLDVVGSAIATGNHHTYRGMLSISGEMLSALFCDTLRQLRECGALTDEESQHASSTLQASIKAAG